jgi:hypothetical protein
LPGRYPIPGVGPFDLLKETEINDWGNLAFRWISWNLLLSGCPIPLPAHMSMAGKRPRGWAAEQSHADRCAVQGSGRRRTRELAGTDSPPLGLRVRLFSAAYGEAMRQPVLLVVDDEAESLRALTRELESRYGSQYGVVAGASASDALASLSQLRAEGAAVSLILADQWMPETTGIELLARARQLHPTARRGC